VLLAAMAGSAMELQSVLIGFCKAGRTLDKSEVAQCEQLAELVKGRLAHITPLGTSFPTSTPTPLETSFPWLVNYIYTSGDFLSYDEHCDWTSFLADLDAGSHTWQRASQVMAMRPRLA